VANYLDTLAEALDMAPQLNPDTDTELDSAKATRIWNRCSAEVKTACQRVGLSPTPSEWTAASAALLVVQQAEALLTSGRCLLARASITKGLRDAARDLMVEAWGIIGNSSPPAWAKSTGPIDGRITWEVQSLLATGAGAADSGKDPRLRSAYTLDRDPELGRVVGVDRPYTPEEAWPENGDL
tara:strand:- start:368 stop:916 length:549 start_codon:yes stop_codon:yes gene_type:complete